MFFIPPTHPLHPVMPNNACCSGITAAAGTCICHNFFLHLPTLFSCLVELYNCYSFLHSRQIDRSYFRTLPNILHCCHKVGLFSYPMWLILLPNQLKIRHKLYIYYKFYLFTQSHLPKHYPDLQ